MSSILPVSSSATIDPAIAARAKQIKADTKALEDALKSNNLADAQKAFAQLQKDAPSSAKANQSGNAAAQTDPLAALGSALKSGDLGAAQTAFTALQKAHHGRHHHRTADAAATPPTNANASAQPGAADSDVGKNPKTGPGAVINTTA